MRIRTLAVAVLAAAVCTGAVVAQQARKSRPVHPANAEKVSYAELDKLPDWRGIWQPNIGRVGGDEPKLIGKYKKRYEEERAKVAANPQYEIPEKTNNC